MWDTKSSIEERVVRESRNDRKHLVRKEVGADWNRAGRRGMTTLAQVRIEPDVDRREYGAVRYLMQPSGFTMEGQIRT